MRFNLADTKVLTNEPVPAGVYPLSVVTCKPKTSKAGNPTIEWVFQIEDENFSGRRVFLNTITAPSAKAWRFLLTLKALGFAEEDLRAPEGFDFEPAECLGLTCWGQVIVKVGEDGRVSNEITRMWSEAEMDTPPEVEGGELALPEWSGNGAADDIQFGGAGDEAVEAVVTGTAKKGKKAAEPA